MVVVDDCSCNDARSGGVPADAAALRACLFFRGLAAGDVVDDWRFSVDKSCVTSAASASASVSVTDGAGDCARLACVLREGFDVDGSVMAVERHLSTMV